MGIADPVDKREVIRVGHPVVTLHPGHKNSLANGAATVAVHKHIRAMVARKSARLSLALYSAERVHL